ncbi:MAG: FkbM family methyltransferase [Saprospiraceae bacterium]|nr:FkbM family methyltransferase [Saprospiraceae bacterium]
MNALLINRKIDLVEYDLFYALMFKNDNLYAFINEKYKNRNLVDLGEKKYPNKKLEICETLIINPKHTVYILLSHLISNKIDFHILDIGAHVGVFSLRCASIFKQLNAHGKITSFNPTNAGALVDFNIKINELEQYINHEMLAISRSGGILNFEYKLNKSDSTRIAKKDNESKFNLLNYFLKAPINVKGQLFIKMFGRFKSIFEKNEQFSLLCDSVNLLDYLSKNKIETNLIIKIDIEGFDKEIIYQILPKLNGRILGLITEFVTYNDIKAIDYLNFLSKHFYIYDIGYCPLPYKCQEINVNNFNEFINDVAYRKYGYTDILLINKNMPKVNLLKDRLNQIK